MVSDVMMTSSDDGDRIINIISKSLCFKCNSNSEPKFTEEQQQIYLGDHLTRSWTRDERAAQNQVASPTTSEPGSKIGGTTSVYQIKGHVPLARSRSSIRESRGSRRNWATKAAIQNVTPEELHDWKESFDNLLKSPLGSKLFRIFLESEIAEENLLFWEACEELKQMKKEKRMQKLIQNIFDDYISVYSPREINIDYKMREDIVEQLNSSSAPDPNVFREAQMQIYHLMHRDSYPRFIASAQAIQDRMDERKRGSKREQREPEVKRKSGSRVLCCYGIDPDDVETRGQTEELKVEESPPVNGKTRSNIQTLKQKQEADKEAKEGKHCDTPSSGERVDTISSLKDTVIARSPQQQDNLIEVTPPGAVDIPRKLSDGATDSSSKRESGIELISFGSTHCDEADVAIEKVEDVINVAPMASDVTYKKISSVEVPVQVIKGPDDSGVIIHEDNAGIIEEKCDVTTVGDDVK